MSREQRRYRAVGAPRRHSGGWVDRFMAANVRGPFLYARACFDALVEAAVGWSTSVRCRPARRAAHRRLLGHQGRRGDDVPGARAGRRRPRGALQLCLPGATAPGMRHIGPADDPDRGDNPTQWPTAPLGRVGTVDDVANAVVYLASPRPALSPAPCSSSMVPMAQGSRSDRTRNSRRGCSSPSRLPPLGSSTVAQVEEIGLNPMSRRLTD